MVGTCGCGARWTGEAIAHCGACHRTFSTVTNFDRHRLDGTCADPAAVGMHVDATGRYRASRNAEQVAA